MAGAVYRDRIALVVPRAPQEGGVDEAGAGRVEFGDERVGAREAIAAASKGSIKRPSRGRKVRSSRGPCDICVPVRVGNDRRDLVGSSAAQISCVNEGINPKRELGIRAG